MPRDPEIDRLLRGPKKHPGHKMPVILCRYTCSICGVTATSAGDGEMPPGWMRWGGIEETTAHACYRASCQAAVEAWGKKQRS